MLNKSVFRTSALLVVCFGLVPTCLVLSEPAGYPPESKIKTVIDTLHGVVIEDPCRWLEDQQSLETRAWIEAQSNYLDFYLDSIPGLDKIRKRQAEIYRIDQVRLPIVGGGRYFYQARRGDDELYKIYVRDGVNGEERLLVDPHPLSQDNSRSVEIISVSLDGSLLAYGIRDGGEDEQTIMILDVNSSRTIDSLPKMDLFNFGIAYDGRGSYYSREVPDGGRVYYHEFGLGAAEDKYLFGDEYGSDKIPVTSLSDDRRHLIISVYYGSSGTQIEVWIKDIVNDGPVTPVVTDIEAQFFVDMVGSDLYVMTDWEAPNWRIMATDTAHLEPAQWQEIVPEAEAVIEQFSLVGGRLFVNYLENVVSRVKIFSPRGEELGKVDLPTLGSGSRMYGNWDTPEGFYSFSSYTYPQTNFRYDINSARSEIWSEVDIPINTDSFEVNQIWYKSKDGTEIPMFLVHGKDLTKTGANPTLLYGYGGFNNNETPYFSRLFAHWIDMGGILAIPNLRGGGEFGEKWHRAGMLDKKQNVFDDFIAAAEWLIENKYTNPSHLGIGGWSNGGLLVGAAFTQRPDLFRAVWCGHPLLDMLRYHMKMAGPYWISELGSADSAPQFDFIYDYSPYHNVKEGVSYPSVLFITGDGDTRVDPMHARKMVALMQARNISDNPILLRYDTHMGHAYTSSVTQSIEENAILLGYMSWQLRLSP